MPSGISPVSRMQELAGVGLVHLDAALEGHREPDLAGALGQLERERAGAGEHGDVAVRGHARHAVLVGGLVLHRVGLVADDRLDLGEHRVDLVVAGDRLDAGGPEDRGRLEVDGGLADRGLVQALALGGGRDERFLGHVEDRLRGAVVHAQGDLVGRRERLGRRDPLAVLVQPSGVAGHALDDAADVVDVGVLEAVDRLLPVAHAAQVRLGAEEQRQLELDLAGVLELVDHDLVELQPVPEGVVLDQEHVREQEQELEVQVVAVERVLEVGHVDVVHEREQGLAVRVEGVLGPGLIDLLGAVRAADLLLRGGVREVQAVPVVAAQGLAGGGLLAAVGLVGLREAGQVGLAVGEERLAAVPVPGLARGEDALGGQLAQQVQEVGGVVHRGEAVRVLGVRVAEPAQERLEELALAHIVLDEAKPGRDAARQAQMRWRVEAVLLDDPLGERVEGRDRRLAQAAG